MAAAFDVARYLIQLAANEQEPDCLSHLRLQKLLYYVQGWSLALRGKPMFDSRIEAWAHGPVVRDLYSKFADYGLQCLIPEKFGEPEDLSKADRQFIGEVWEAYKDYSATSLREMTHKETPWIEARNGCGPADRSDAEITPEAMRSFFSRAATSAE